MLAFVREFICGRAFTLKQAMHLQSLLSPVFSLKRPKQKLSNINNNVATPTRLQHKSTKHPGRLRKYHKLTSCTTRVELPVRVWRCMSHFSRDRPSCTWGSCLLHLCRASLIFPGRAEPEKTERVAAPCSDWLLPTTSQLCADFQPRTEAQGSIQGSIQGRNGRILWRVFGKT